MRLARRLLDQIRGIWTGLLAPAEDPRKAFATGYARQKQLLSAIQRSLAEVALLKSELAGLIASTEARLPRFQDEAWAALQQGQDDLARQVVQRGLIAKEELDELKAQVGGLEAEEQRLLGAERRLADQVESFSANQQLAAARLTTTEAQARVSESLRSVARELSALGIALEEAEGKAEAMQARASEIDGLLLKPPEETESGRGQKAIKQKLADRDLHSRVETELEAIRRKRR